ncbi:MAG: response regulator, partial [Desulfuromonadales bacterium]
ETGAIVHVAGDGQEAVTMITEGSTSYDLVLMVIQMPVMDGYEATRMIRSDSRFTSLPIIAMTAHAMQEERQKIREAGIDAHITKPIDARTLLRVLGFFLSAQESSAHLRDILDDDSGIEPIIPDIKGLDVAEALSRLDGDRKLYLWVLLSFLENESNAAMEIEEALNGGDTKSALRHLHTVKGIAGTIGALKLTELAMVLETTIGQDDPHANIMMALEPFAAELERLMKELNDHLQVASQTGVILPASLDVAVVTPILNKLLDYIKEKNGKAERYLDDYNKELAGLPEKDINILRKHLFNFDFSAAHDSLMALAAKNGIDI